MTAKVTYMIEATVGGADGEMPYAVRLPVRRVSRPGWREAMRLIRGQYPSARLIHARRSAEAHLEWARSGEVRKDVSGA